MVTKLFRGLAAQPGEPWDQIYAEDIVNHLFENKMKGNGSGLDLIGKSIL